MRFASLGEIYKMSCSLALSSDNWSMIDRLSRYVPVNFMIGQITVTIRSRIDFAAGSKVLPRMIVQLPLTSLGSSLRMSVNLEPKFKNSLLMSRQKWMEISPS